MKRERESRRLLGKRFAEYVGSTEGFRARLLLFCAGDEASWRAGMKMVFKAGYRAGLEDAKRKEREGKKD